MAEQTIEINVSGMTCGSCVGRVESALKKIDGVYSAAVNLATEKAKIIASSRLKPQQLIIAIEKAGYDAKLITQTTRVKPSAPTYSQRALLVSILLTLPLVLPMIGAIFGRHLMLDPWIQLALATPIQFGVGWKFYLSAWKAMRARTGNMDLLVAVGTSAAYGLSIASLVRGNGDFYFETAAAVTTFILLGKNLEARAKRQTLSAMEALQNLQPEKARVVVNGIEKLVPISEVRTGDAVRVIPGEKIPVDGVVLDGASAVDESLLTGESIPVFKKVTDTVTAGALNTDGVLLIETRKIGAETTLARIIRLIEDAQSAKAPIQLLVDRVSAIFVPVVLILAVITFLLWLPFTTTQQALIDAICVLVIACPCALGLATPTAILAGTGAAAQAGILIRDAEILELAHRVSVVAFDKTGTLTEGKPQLIALQSRENDSNRLLQIAGSLQSASEHPLANAVVAASRMKNLPPLLLTQFQNSPGRGVSGNLQEIGKVWIGTRTFLRENEINLTDWEDEAKHFEESGHTVSFVAWGSPARVQGVLTFQDEPRPTAQAAIKSLHAQNLELWLLTGDSPANANRVGETLGIKNISGGLLPAEKSACIESLKTGARIVAMVGDGINDGPALASADLGIALASGTELARRSAGITLMRPDLRLVAAALEISRKTYQKIKQGLFWAFIYNCIGIGLAMAGKLDPIFAGFAMAMSSVSVVLNALWLKRWRPNLSA